MNHIGLTEEQKQSLAANHGCVQGEGYVLMSTDVFLHTMGIDSDDELVASLNAIQEGHADVEAGRTRPFRDVLAELGSDDAIRS